MRIAELIVLRLLENVDANPPVYVYHVTPAHALKQIMVRGLEPRVGPRARKLKEPVPAIYFFKSRAEAEDAVMNWLGDEYGEDTQLALLQVALPPGSREVPGAGYERVISSPIPPGNIKVVADNF